MEEDIFQVRTADFHLLRVHAALAQGGQQLLDIGRIVGRNLHDTPRHTGAGSDRFWQSIIGFELQHGAGGRFEQIVHAREGDDLAALEHGHATAQRLGLFQVVRGQQHGVALLVELGDKLPQRLAQLHIDPGGGLVQHDHRRLVDQGLGHHHAPLHAARELAHIGRGLIGQAQAF